MFLYKQYIVFNISLNNSAYTCKLALYLKINIYGISLTLSLWNWSFTNEWISS